ncbi:DNA polymerase III subunit gamma and tau [Arthrobacter sp. B3I4]|uniref:DNA polymerase III subunit gamma and tau n=1 Tax=Arthrobacter sp. B3I4 TaxID=3042267 RepID=UPI0027867CDD|nr:DNA polymerase III subunit gamma and tau [Arthrobacter sp. B3I4]MDQ0754357.1 DNA polymerase-3 subunit gamma/tau [Arthrobacter sp. B3I4]
MTVTTALYRRYRPDSFADVIGQEHVTEPLMTALRKNRVNHAYLFSGPRGCGKTTSARILARCLNCAEGPTDTPCGVCPSCVELARGGAGSLDVIEIDAASHGGVDDARDLRERATYAPVRDRYKIFIIDEAHMVTSAGFNALLKIVEEPPEHIKFIFATTEPDKVIGTIRSRTHHYPFRLVPPEPLMAYLELLCRQENVAVAPGVLSLVIRAGGGSVRDSLSVLDQLMAGAGPNGLDYELAVALLGYTHASLLDDVVEAVAASDAATVFRAVDRVIQTGHDPRRFVEDLLERFRDLIIVQAMPESAQSILRGMPADQIARMQNQSHNLGAAELSRAADVTNTALTEMTGATSPRLHLELLCARILLPSAEQTERGIAARIDRVERRLNYAGNDVSAPAPAAAAPGQAPQEAARPAETQRPTAAPAGPPAASPGHAAAGREAQPERVPLVTPRVSTNDWPVDGPASPTGATRPEPVSAPEAQPSSTNRPEPTPHTPAPKAPAPTAPVHAERPAADVPATAPGAAQRPASAQAQAPASAPAPAPAQAPAPASASAPASGSGPDVEVLRRAWPDILQTLTKIKRSTWALVEPNAQVGHFEGQVLTLSFTTSGLAGAFGRADHAENLRQAIHKTIGIDCQITAVAGGANSTASSEPNPKAPTSREATASSADVAWGLAPADVAAAPDSPPKAADGAGEQSAAAQSAAAASSAVVPQAAPGAPGRPARQDVPAPEPARQSTEPPATVPAAAPAAPAAQTGAPAWSSPGAGSDDSGSYSYPDDDWGPPLDEDAPPLDEEPPMDWVPSAPAPVRHAAVDAPAPAPTAPRVRSGSSVVGTAAGAPVAPAQPAHDPSEDPWARAVEQSPGVWTVGTELNVGRRAPVDAAAEVPQPGPEPERPHYEPAAAQIPEPVGALSAVSNSGYAGGSGERVPATQREPVPASPPATRLEPAAAGGTAPITAAASPVVATASVGAPPATGRQSLYQRLSNSPEAEAGRAKAPARAAVAATAYEQDIPSADDETIEESGVFGRAAVERILGGKLLEERSLDGSPLAPRS